MERAIVAHTLIPVLAARPEPADRITGQVVRVLRPGVPKR
jgi:hypothetical protein